MDRLAGLIATGDQVASIVGAVIAAIGLVLTVRASPRPAATGTARRRRPRGLGVVLLLGAALALRSVPGVPSPVATAAGWSLPVLGLLAVALAVHRRRRPPPVRLDEKLVEMLNAQRVDAARHRYRFFGQHVPALTDVYVWQRAQLGIHEAGEAGRSVSVVDMLSEHRHIVLLGGAGAGKSTLVAALAAENARAVLGGGEPSVVTAVVPAADLIGRSVPEALAVACRRDLNVAVPDRLFAAAPVPRGQWRVLVDGIDEVIDTESRSQLLWRLGELLDDTGGPYRLLVTCRPLPDAELAELRRPGTGEYELRPFDRADLDEFALRWFTARRPNDQVVATVTAARFLARVAGARLGPVARVPLLATIAALVFEQADGAALPSSRAALYDSFVAHLLDGRAELSQLRETLGPALRARGAPGIALAAWLDGDLYGIVGRLLDALGEHQVREPEADPVPVAARWLRGAAPYDLVEILPDGARVLRRLLLATGLFGLRRDRLRFVHQSFAEFFAARAGADNFDELAWRAQVANPAARSLATFAAARRPDADRLVRVLLDDTDDVVAAGDLLADGVPVTAGTRARLVATLITQLRTESDSAPECLRVLRELSVDGDVLGRLADLADDEAVSRWTRAVVADTIADVDRATGIPLLRRMAAGPDSAVAEWAEHALSTRGVSLFTTVRTTRDGSPDHRFTGPLGSLARQALSQRAQDPELGDRHRADAAIQLAASGELGPLRALIDAPGIRHQVRLSAASTLADLGDETPLVAFAASSVARPGAALLGAGERLPLRYGASVELLHRNHPAAADLLRGLIRDCLGGPRALGAALRLAEVGELAPLTEVATADNELPELGRAAAELLARFGGPAALDQVLQARVPPSVRAWALAGLLRHGRPGSADRLRQMLHHGRLPAELRLELHYILAAHGDQVAHQWLRRRAGASLRPVRDRLAAAVALAALADPVGPATVARIAYGRGHSTAVRMVAATSLVRADASAGRALLATLAAPPHRAVVRWRAAGHLAERFGSLDALCELILDPTAPVDYRNQAHEHLMQIVAWSDYSPAVGRPEARLPDRPAMPVAYAVKIAELVQQPDTPVRLRIAIATRTMSEEQLGERLRQIVRDHKVRSWHRATTAVTLASLDLSAAGTDLLTFVQDRRISRFSRWYLLFKLRDYLPAGDDLPDGDDRARQGPRLDVEFAGQFARLAGVYGGPGWLVPFRIAALVVTQPAPTGAGRPRLPVESL